jgi:hypothetical protein
MPPIDNFYYFYLVLFFEIDKNLDQTKKVIYNNFTIDFVCSKVKCKHFLEVVLRDGEKISYDKTVIEHTITKYYQKGKCASCNSFTENKFIIHQV